MQRVNSAADLSGTVYAVDGAVFLFESLILVQLGFILPILGVLLYTEKKGSYFWLLGFLPVIVLNVGITWEPSHYTVTFWYRRGGNPSFISWNIVVLDPDLHCLRR